MGVCVLDCVGVCVLVSADFSCFGSSVDGGEGFSFYLYGGYTLDQSIGSPGPGLGYAPTDALVEVDGTDTFSGVNNAVLGVGFDIVGDFALPLGGDVEGDSVAHPNAVTLRKGTADDFEYIGSSSPLSANGFDIYQVYGDTCPNITSTPTPTRTQTQTQTFTNTWGSTATATPTKTQTNTVTQTNTYSATRTTTRTNSQTPTRTKTRTPSSTHTTTYTKSQTPLPSKSVTRTQTPTNTLTHTTTQTKTTSQTPTKTALYPTKKSVKVRITNYGKKAIVYVRNSTCGDFVKVYEKDLLGLTIPAGNHVMVGLSYSTGVRCSKFYIYKFEVNGIGFENQYTPTQTRTITRTPTQTRTSTENPTPSSTRTRTPSQSPTQTQTATQTPTQTSTQTQTRTETPPLTRTQTPTQSRTQTPTQTPTSTQTPTYTRTQSPTQTQTPTASPIPEIGPLVDGTFMFRFTSLFYRAANYDQAVKIMINNGRYLFNQNQTSSYLFDWNGEALDLENREFAVPYCQKQVNNFGDLGWCGTLCHNTDVGGNNYYTQAFFYDGNAVSGQRGEDPGGDGVTGWRGTRMLPPGAFRHSNNPDLTHRGLATPPSIPQAVWTALGALFQSGGTTYDECKLNINATDDSLFKSGSDYNVWPVDLLLPTEIGGPYAEWDWADVDRPNHNNQQTAWGWPSVMEGCAYNLPNGTQEQILYNFDYITDSPILPGESPKSRLDFDGGKPFAGRRDLLRPVPNTRYLRIKQGDIDITFSYATEFVDMWEGYTVGANMPMGMGHRYPGARITLWTGSYQGYQP